jgi:DNA-binding NarL/FixJ family response regulator
MEKITILLIEDNRLLREGITAMLNGQEDFEVIACSEDGDSIDKLKSIGIFPAVVLWIWGWKK